MSGPEQMDAVVIGGGPGGSTAATLLARQGFDVRLLERESFPRDHVGESLLPATLPILEELGVLDAVRAEGFVEKWGATMVWGLDPEPWSWYFRETNLSYPHSYQVWRPRFDELLLCNSRRAGADVRTRHAVREVVFSGERATGVRYTDASGQARSCTARFVLDASGQTALLARRLRVRRWDPFFRNLAVYAYLSGGRHLPPPDQGNIFIESFEHGWFWLIPLHTGWTSAGAVLDREIARSGIRTAGLRSFFGDQLERAPRARSLLEGARIERGPHLVKDWSYRARRLVGPGWLLVGDAACFVDPLFSSGVHLAMTSGVLAAAYVSAALRDPSLAPEAERAYARLYSAQYEHFHQLAQLFYAGNRTVESYFWHARRLLPESAAFSPREAFVRAVAGQPPAGYERAALARGELPVPFAQSVRRIEEEREQRRARFARAERRELLRATPRRALGVRVEQRAVLGQGAFEWGSALVSTERAEEVPCSALVSELVGLAQGDASLGAIAARLAGPEADGARVHELVLQATEILYVDGLLDLDLSDRASAS